MSQFTERQFEKAAWYWAQTLIPVRSSEDRLRHAAFVKDLVTDLKAPEHSYIGIGNRSDAMYKLDRLCVLHNIQNSIEFDSVTLFIEHGVILFKGDPAKNDYKVLLDPDGSFMQRFSEKINLIAMDEVSLRREGCLNFRSQKHGKVTQKSSMFDSSIYIIN